MKHSEVLSRYVNTGTHIPEKQYNRLSKSLQKSYLRMRGIAGYEEWEFKVINDDERIKFIEKNVGELDINDLQYFISISNNKDNIITKIIETLGNNLRYFHIIYLLKFSDNKDFFVTKIINIKGVELDDKEIRSLLSVLYENKYNTTPSILKIIEIKGKSLDTDVINNLLKYSDDKDDIVTKIIEIKDEELESDEIDVLLDYSSNKNDIVTKIIQVKGKVLTEEDIWYLFDYLKKDKELINKTLLQNGVDYNLINKVITTYNIDTPLIPDNYQSMLNEIRRIKEIMK